MNQKNQTKTIQDFIDKQVQQLKANTPKQSGALANSIKGGYDKDSIEIEALDYYKFIDDGVKGVEGGTGKYGFKSKMPPIKAFASYTDDLSHQFAIARSIYKNGIKAKNITDKSITDSEIDKFATDYTNAVWEDYAEEQNKNNKKTKK